MKLVPLAVLAIAAAPGAAAEPPVVPAAERPPAVRVETDPLRAAIAHLAWDTEGGGRADRNLLRPAEGIALRIKAGGAWSRSADRPATAEASPGGGRRYRIAAGGGAEISWSISAGPGGTVAFEIRIDGAGAGTVEGAEVAFAFDPAVTPTTALPAEWSDDGSLRLPAVLSAPDWGQMLLRCREVPALRARLEGSRAKKTVDLFVELPPPLAGKSFSIDLEPVRLPAPAGLAARDLWAAARRGWFGALQPSARWGEQDRPFSAPAGILGNNAISDPASCSLWFYADQALWTPEVAPGISAAALVRRSIDWWLDQRVRPTGEVIGYWDYGNFLDANAGPLIAAWDYAEATGDRKWLERRIAKLEEVAAFLARRDVDGDGLVEAVQSGNLGTLVQPNRSCAWWDALNCGGKDGYTNAIAFRAWRCLADLETRLGRAAEAARWAALAGRLRAAYRDALYDPATGWLGWWRSADGELHDYASPAVNGIAIEYGLVDPAEGRAMLERLWAKIEAVGFRRFDLGVPPMLVPVRRGDYLKDGLGCPRAEDGADTFGQYMNGGITAGQVLHFLAAHYVAGWPERADRVLRAMLERQARGEFQDGVTDAGGRGIDWTTWDGKPCGYEGYLADSFRFLQAVLLREASFRDRYYRPLRDGLSFLPADGKPGEIAIARYPGGPPGSKDSKSVPVAGPARIAERRVAAVKGRVHAYASFAVGPRNPEPLAGGRPGGHQTLALGKMDGGRFVEAFRFGVVDDERDSPRGMARYVPGARDGRIDHYGPHARPDTTHDFRVVLDLEAGRATAWVAARGDDDWYVLAAGAPLAAPVDAIDAVRAEQLPDAPGIDRVVVGDRPWPEGESIRAGLPKAGRVVGPGKGFRLRSMRSLWRRADRHVTVAREPGAERGWWLGFPDVARTGPESLVCAYVDGPGHGGGGAMSARRSDDLGRTWSAPAVIHPSGINCPRIQVVRDGSLVALGDLHGSAYPVVLYRSADGGRTWTGIGKLDPPAAGGRGTCVPSRLTEVDDGSWLIHGTYTPGSAWKVTSGETIEFYRSADAGKSWALFSSLPPPPPLSICETSIVELPAGRWLLVARESGGFLPGVRSWSTDRGKTWSPLEELPFFIQGRTCAGLLPDGRAMVTFRADSGPAALWAWIGRPDEPVRPVVRGIHFNDGASVGLRDGALHLDSDGAAGQFTKYIFRPPDGPGSRVEVTTVVKVLENRGRAATVSVPFVGKLRLFPGRAELAHDRTLGFAVEPGEFHAYAIASAGGKATISVDGRERLVTDRTERQACPLAWSALTLSPYLLSFGNEEGDGTGAGDRSAATPRTMFASAISPAVTGYSQWRSFEVRYDDPATGARRASWRAEDGFPDQHALDHVIEIDATISGCDQGYSGWTPLPDGRIFVVNYTDDGARWNRDAGDPALGVAWIRGTYVLPEDLPPR